MKITKENILLDCDVSRKEELLTKVSQRALELGIVDSAEKILHGFLQREEEGPTGLQDYFAIPHTKSESVLESSIIYVRNKSILTDWESFDEKGIKHAFALFVKKTQEQNKHLTILSNLAISLMNDAFRSTVEKISNEEDLAQVIATAIIK